MVTPDYVQIKAGTTGILTILNPKTNKVTRHQLWPYKNVSYSLATAPGTRQVWGQAPLTGVHARRRNYLGLTRHLIYLQGKEQDAAGRQIRYVTIRPGTLATLKLQGPKSSTTHRLWPEGTFDIATVRAA